MRSISWRNPSAGEHALRKCLGQFPECHISCSTRPPKRCISAYRPVLFQVSDRILSFDVGNKVMKQGSKKFEHRARFFALYERKGRGNPVFSRKKNLIQTILYFSFLYQMRTVPDGLVPNGWMIF